MLSKTPPHSVDPLYNYMQKASKKPATRNENRIFNVPESQGLGSVKCFYIEKGFCVGYYNFSLKEDLHFKWIHPNETQEQPIFKLIFRLNHQTLKHTGITTKAECSATENSSVLYSTDFERSGFIPKDKWYSAIGIIFTASWLKENFEEASEEIYNTVSLLVKKNKPTFISELMDQLHYDVCRQLAIEMCSDRITPIHIKAKSLVLMNDFLTEIVNRKAADITSNQTIYQEEMIKVEKRLSHYFDKPFPHINKLAKEFNMTASTLKRHFKIVYGKNIHQYYLEKKLAIGKEMIITNKKSVSEIAFMLGYHKINSFSKVFKKYYGILPKEYASA